MNPSLARKRLAVGLRLTEPLPICFCSMPATMYSDDRPRDESERGVEHRHVDELAAAGVGALVERARHGQRGGDAADRVADGEPGAHRAAGRLDR